MQEVVKHWHRLPRETVDVPSLKTFTVEWGSEQLVSLSLAVDETKGVLKIPPNPNHPTIL